MSIRDLLDKVEGANEHVLYITGSDWKMTHPLACRMVGLVWCAVNIPEGLPDGTYALRDEQWEAL